jgi:hypothetical protein
MEIGKWKTEIAGSESAAIFDFRVSLFLLPSRGRTAIGGSKLEIRNPKIEESDRISNFDFPVSVFDSGNAKARADIYE